MTDLTSDPKVAEALAALGLEEKVQLLTGRDFWTTWPIEKIGLRRILVSDGPSGVRGETWDERDPSLNLPSATALASSWDPDIARRYGAAAGSHLPPQVWRKASLPLQWMLQRTPQHRPELAESDRAQLIDYFSEDIDIVEAETGWDLRDWRIYREGGTYSVRKSWAPSRRLVS